MRFKYIIYIYFMYIGVLPACIYIHVRVYSLELELQIVENTMWVLWKNIQCS